MRQPRQPQGAPARRRSARRWRLGEAAPGWFRRVWGERSREVPKPLPVDMSRMRRIAYL